MTGDASFRDGADRPLALRALDADDLAVLSAMAQDAVFPASEMRWDRRRRRFAALVNRFRWEDRDGAARQGRPPERVRAILAIEDVRAVRSQGIDPRDGDLILSLLSVTFAAGEDGTGTVTLTLAGDGAVAVEVEALEVVLRDVTRPYAAPSRKVPAHRLD